MAHTLTWRNLTVLVNNSLVPSPYTLQDGDVIKVYGPSNEYAIINGSVQAQGATLNLSNTDITISKTGGSND